MSGGHGVNVLPFADRIRGAIFDALGTLEESRVTIQYTDHKGQWNEISMPFLDAMYLLNMLKGIQLDVGYKMPDDPRLK